MKKKNKHKLIFISEVLILLLTSVTSIWGLFEAVRFYQEWMVIAMMIIWSAILLASVISLILLLDRQLMRRN